MAVIDLLLLLTLLFGAFLLGIEFARWWFRVVPVRERLAWHEHLVSLYQQREAERENSDDLSR